MGHKIQFSTLDYNTGEKHKMVVIDPPDPIDAHDMLSYFVRFCVVAGYNPDSVESAIVDYALPLLKEIAAEVESKK